MSNSTQKQLIKKINARTQKWRVMIANGLHKDRSLLKSRVRKGIPPAIRILAWPQLVSLQQFIDKSPYNYQKLTNSLSNNIYEISLDIPRTFPQEQDSIDLRKPMNNILKMGYCQGMNFLAVRLLQILNEENSFWLLHYLFENDPKIRIHFMDPRTIDKENYVFQKLLQDKIPQVYANFKENNVFISAFTIKWFMTLYSGYLKQQIFNRIFQSYLLWGWNIIYSAALGLIKYSQKKILKNSMDENLLLLGTNLYKIEDVQAFMEIVYSMQISTDKINTIQKQYNMKKGIHNSQTTLMIQKQLQTRQNFNKDYKFQKPQEQAITHIKFQNKFQEINFSSLLLLKKTHN